MNYIYIVMMAFTAVTIVLGVLLGLMRGWKRSLLRLGLVVLSVVLAFALCGTVSKAILDANIAPYIPEVEVETMTVADYVVQMFGDLPESISGLALVLAQSLVKVIMFLLLFGAFQFLTWAIVFPICKIIVKPRTYTNKDGKTVKKKGRLLGAGIGLVQGLVVCVCVCVVLTGLLMQANKIMEMASDLQSLSGSVGAIALADEDSSDFVIDDGNADVDTDDKIDDGYDGDVKDDLDNGYTYDGDDNGDVERDPDIGDDQTNGGDTGKGEFDAYIDTVTGYTDSPLGKLYNKIGAKWFDKLSEVENANGDKVTLSGQLDAIRGVVNLAKELIRFKDIDFNKLLQIDNVENIQEIFNALQRVNESLSKESKDTIKNVLTSAAEEMNLPINLSGLDFDEIDFSKEGEIFIDLYHYSQNEEFTDEDTKQIVEKIAESDIILDLLADQDGVDLSQQLEHDPHRESIEESISEMEEKGEIEQDKIDALKKIFGIGSNTNPNPDDGGNSNTDSGKISDSGDNSEIETPKVEVEDDVEKE